MGVDPPFLTHPGIGYLSGAVILSEHSDISKNEHPSMTLSFAGLEPSYSQSVQSECTEHIVNYDSSHLHYALMNAWLPLIIHNPVYKYPAQKRAEGKPYRVALTHVAKKLLRVIYTLQTKNISYYPKLIR